MCIPPPRADLRSRFSGEKRFYINGVEIPRHRNTVGFTKRGLVIRSDNLYLSPLSQARQAELKRACTVAVNSSRFDRYAASRLHSSAAERRCLIPKPPSIYLRCDCISQTFPSLCASRCTHYGCLYSPLRLRSPQYSQTTRHRG